MLRVVQNLYSSFLHFFYTLEVFFFPIGHGTNANRKPHKWSTSPTPFEIPPSFALGVSLLNIENSTNPGVPITYTNNVTNKATSFHEDAKGDSTLYTATTNLARCGVDLRDPNFAIGECSTTEGQRFNTGHTYVNRRSSPRLSAILIFQNYHAELDCATNNRDQWFIYYANGQNGIFKNIIHLTWGHTSLGESPIKGLLLVVRKFF
jgi:hypothetical protein